MDVTKLFRNLWYRWKYRGLPKQSAEEAILSLMPAILAVAGGSQKRLGYSIRKKTVYII